MPQIDLEPTEYRTRGWKKPRRHVSDRSLKWMMTACGVWAAAAIYFYRVPFPTQPGWWGYAAGLAPGLLLWAYVVATAKD